MISRIARVTLVASFILGLAASSALNSPGAAGISSAVPVASETTSAAIPTVSTVNPSVATAFPKCDGMQLLPQAVKFDWPNLNEHMQEFSRSQWTYFSCEQPASAVASLYRQQLPRPPYGMAETNWLERQEGTLGVYFSRSGAWDYIWFISQPDDPQRSYVIIGETFAYVEC